MGLLDVVKWRGVGVYLFVTAVWQGQLYLHRRREGLDQTWSCRCVSGSLLAYGMKIPPVKSMHRTIYCSTQLKLQIRKTVLCLFLAIYVTSGFISLLACILLWNSHFYCRICRSFKLSKYAPPGILYRGKKWARFSKAAALCLLSKAFRLGSVASLASYCCRSLLMSKLRMAEIITPFNLYLPVTYNAHFTRMQCVFIYLQFRVSCQVTWKLFEISTLF
jgi:hypothetical protein